MKDDQLYVLSGVVHRNSSQVTLPLKFSETVGNAEVNLECLLIYATPLAFEPYDDSVVSLTRKWKLTARASFLEKATQTISLGTVTESKPQLMKLLAALKKDLAKLSQGPYAFLKDPPNVSFSSKGPALLLTLPAGWFMEFSSKSLAKCLSLENGSFLVQATELESGKLRLENSLPDTPATFFGGQLSLGPIDVDQPTGTEMTITFGPLQQVKTAFYESVRPTGTGKSNDVKGWVSKALKELLASLDLSSNLVACRLSETGMSLIANQDLEHQPLVLEFEKDQSLGSDLHSHETGNAVLHFNLKPFEAATREAKAEDIFAKWGSTATKEKLVWTDPLKKIAPFYLLADDQEGSSFMDGSFVSVAAVVGQNLQVKERVPLKVKSRQGKLSLKFVDGYLQECVFATPFNVFLVCRMF